MLDFLFLGFKDDYLWKAPVLVALIGVVGAIVSRAIGLVGTSRQRAARARVLARQIADALAQSATSMRLTGSVGSEDLTTSPTEIETLARKKFRAAKIAEALAYFEIVRKAQAFRAIAEDDKRVAYASRLQEDSDRIVGVFDP